MAIEHAAWVLPTIEGAYKHREELASGWEKIIAHLVGVKSQIAITGMAGVGKSVLFEHLTGAAYERDHPMPPQPTRVVEKGRILARKKRIYLTTIPGQLTDFRYIDSQEAFEGKRPVVGVIHVTANGFATNRKPSIRADLIKSGVKTVHQYQAHQIQQEVEDLKTACEMIRRSSLKHRKRIWMVVAVTKCDLFASDLELVESYYSPHGKNPFVDELKTLEAQLGTLFFSWDAVPVCASLEDFDWNGYLVQSTLKPAQQNQLIGRLLKRIEQDCA